jgi:hypothetical protein
MLEVRYSAPIVNERDALKIARDRIYALKRSRPAREEGVKLLEHHSR